MLIFYTWIIEVFVYSKNGRKVKMSSQIQTMFHNHPLCHPTQALCPGVTKCLTTPPPLCVTSILNDPYPLRLFFPRVFNMPGNYLENGLSVIPLICLYDEYHYHNRPVKFLLHFYLLKYMLLLLLWVKL